MSNAEVHTLTGAYAADALDDAEREVFERHLRDCAACRAEVAELTATTTRLAVAAAAPAPARLRSAVLDEVARTRQLPPLSEVSRLDDRRRPWHRQPAAVAAALMLVVSAGLAGVAISERRHAQRAEERAEQIAAIATDPQGARTVVDVAGGGTGTVLWSSRGGALFRATSVRPLRGGQVYQLWLLHRDGPESVGVLGSGGALEAVIPDLGSGDGLGLTIEPAGGSPAPTGELVLRVDVA